MSGSPDMRPVSSRVGLVATSCRCVMRRFVLPALALFLPIVLSACASDSSSGYTFTSAHPSHVQSVAVEVFDNPTFSRGIEAELADALVKEIQRTTPYTVVQSGQAQTVLTGSITDARMRQLTASRTTGLSEEVIVDLIVTFEWRDARTGQPIIRRVNFRALETFVAARPSNERLELGRHSVVQEMARSIVAELRSAW